jgi:hypothetical protein
MGHNRVYSGMSRRSPENFQNDSSSREKLYCQNPQHSGITKRYNDTAHDKMLNRLNLTTGGNDMLIWMHLDST